MAVAQHITAVQLELLENVLGQAIMAAFHDEAISEIIVNSDGKLIVEHRTSGKACIGKYTPADCHHAMSLLAQQRGFYLNNDQPDVVLNFPETAPFCGARLQGLIPPSVVAPAMVIRKHNRKITQLETFVAQGIVSKAQARYLRLAIQQYKNIVVSGQPKSGKTTLTNALLNEIPCVANPKDRVLILEDVPELRLAMEDVEYLKTSTVRTMTDLLRASMRMRPDRIMVGEVTDGAALTLLKAWNTGCPGGISTLHANHCQAALQRLCDLACENGIPAPISLIETSVHVLVHIARGTQYPAGRAVTEIAELVKFDRAQQRFQLKYINT